MSATGPIHPRTSGPPRDEPVTGRCGGANLSDARRREFVDFDRHSLRHFTADFFYVVRGYGPELAAYQLGHTDPNLVIRRYGKPFPGGLDRLERASDGPRVVPLRPVGDDAQEGGHRA